MSAQERPNGPEVPPEDSQAADEAAGQATGDFFSQFAAMICEATKEEGFVCTCWRKAPLVHRQLPPHLRREDAIPGTPAVACGNPNAFETTDDKSLVTCQECREIQSA